ncbi:hypothetical protein C8F04DRAFT_1197974 [Mycena alexandri]|uniref:Uncharacterized protein n=1 Tax=Mycena alexandri TaxID=1745969 RepID=A0AAD6WNI4_9AGAR|nr:hypothetical protein C8F04DRAFT_1197974 [Mycena alexandri]
MDPNNPVFEQSYNDTVTPSGYPSDLVTSSGYPSDSATPGGYFDAAQHPPVDVAALMATNNELVEMVRQMRLGYNDHVKTEMQAYQDALKDDFQAVRAQRDKAQAEAQAVSAQMAATIARLERLEGTSSGPPEHERTRDPRTRPASSKATPAPATPSKARPANTHSTAKPKATKQPQSPNTPRRSKSSKDSGAHSSSKAPHTPPNPTRPTATPPRGAANPPQNCARLDELCFFQGQEWEQERK